MNKKNDFYDRNKKGSLFDKIAPFYGLFYNIQKRNFKKVLNEDESKLNLAEYKTIIDIGCGTGALTSVFNEKGFDVTGIDVSQKMLNKAISKQENKSINFINVSVLEGLPFEDKSFDVSIASYVAHGLIYDDRKILYSEMSRVSKQLVIIHDYNKNRAVLTDFIEWLEGGDYFNFIKNAEEEMKYHFQNVKIINVRKRAALYNCTPINYIKQK